VSPDSPPPAAEDLLRLVRKAAPLSGRTDGEAEVVVLLPSQILHPGPGREYRLKAGLLRVGELMSDGREVTRAILQTGAGFETLRDDPVRADPAEDVYPVGRVILMSLGETELVSRPRATPTKER